MNFHERLKKLNCKFLLKNFHEIPAKNYRNFHEKNLSEKKIYMKIYS